MTDLAVSLAASGVPVISDVSFRIGRGEIVGLVGESGSGKTTVAMAMLGHVRKGAALVRGSVEIDGTDIVGMPNARLRSARGRIVSYVPQDPAAALDPSITIGRQLQETIRSHEKVARSALGQRIRELLIEVGLQDVEGLLRRYPHQLSGGQRQRVCIAMAFACRPACVVLDEPTTGLDVTTQATILLSVRRLAQEYDVSMLYITHDLAVIEGLADRIMVMYAGRLVEQGPAERVFGGSAHPYSRALIATTPDVRERLSLQPIPGAAPKFGEAQVGCSFADRCAHVEHRCREEVPPAVMIAVGHESACWAAHAMVAERSRLDVQPEPALPGGTPVLIAEDIKASYQDVEVVHGVSLRIHRGECLALVGESGSGKTTLSRVLIGLTRDATGRLELNGETLPLAIRRRTLRQRHSMQYVFQSPRSSLNPRRTVFESVEAPLIGVQRLSARDRRERAFEALSEVGLSASMGQRFPDQLSGGERQRVGIARALACRPDVLVCDEITSALDVSVQASIVGLLERLRSERGLALLFVTHNLALVRTIADRVVVLRTGTIVEEGPTSTTLQAPTHPYTQALLRDTPSIIGAVDASREAE